MVSDLGSPPRCCQNEIFKSAKEQIEELQLITPLARLCGFRRLEVDSWRHLRIQKQLGEAWAKARFASCGHGNFCSSCRRFHAWDSRFRNVSLDRDKEPGMLAPVHCKQSSGATVTKSRVCEWTSWLGQGLHTRCLTPPTRKLNLRIKHPNKILHATLHDLGLKKPARASLSEQARTGKSLSYSNLPRFPFTLNPAAPKAPNPPPSNL